MTKQTPLIRLDWWLVAWGSTSVWRLVQDPEEMRFVQHSYTSDVLYGDRFKARCDVADVADVADWDGHLYGGFP